MASPTVESQEPLKRLRASHPDYDRSIAPVCDLVPIKDILANTKPPSWQIHGLLEAGVLAQLYGSPESGKSLVAQHMAACTATGQDFFGRPVKKGLVVYLCGEGFRGLQRRWRAWEMAHDVGVGGTPLVVSRTAISLFDDLGADAARRAIQEAETEHGEPLRLLIVDTLARHMAGGNENSTQDMNVFLANVATLTGDDAATLLVHHTGHGDQSRSRGASSLIGAVDAEYRAEKSGECITITAGKLKDGERPSPLAFKLCPAKTDLCYEDGSPADSVVLEPTEVIEDQPGKRLTQNDRLGLNTLYEAIREYGQYPPTGILGRNKFSTGQKVVEESFWRDIFYRRRVSEKDSPEAKRKAFQRLRDKLQRSRCMQKDGLYYWALQTNGTAGT